MTFPTNRLSTAALLAVVLLAAAPAAAQTSGEGEAALSRLADSVDRLARLLEQEQSARAGARETRTVEAAVAILGLRYRKIEQLERRIRQISEEEEDFDSRMELMKVDLDRLEEQLPPAGDPNRSELESAWSDMKLRLKLEEDRIQRQREKRLMLENDLAAEQRRLARLEEILDDWLDSLE